ncbi:carbon-nitrogen hydrolase [Balneolales bacterium ANBcel1]|nr:carbon-nitrogen hydrolase [Balneolales bacterium ANBcel1]
MPRPATTIAMIQTPCGADIPANIRNTFEKIRDAAAGGSQIIILQELFAWPYFCREVDDRFFDWAEPVPGPLTFELEKLAEELEVVIVASLFEKRAAGLYHNTAVVIDADGRYAGKYRKMHIPEDPGFHEKYYFTPGDLGYSVFETRYGRIGVLICWDQWYPEAARITAMMGADLLVYPTAIASLPEEAGTVSDTYRDAWQTIQRSHAIANGCYVASVNRVGTEGSLSFWGHSFLCGPFGEVIAQGGGEEKIVTGEMAPSALDRHRTTWPFFRDRRTDTYQPVTSRWLDEDS